MREILLIGINTDVEWQLACEAVKYVRADTLPVVTDNGKVNVGLIAENERLQEQIFEQQQYKDFHTAVDYLKAFVMQKQAAAAEYEIISLCSELRKSGYRGISVKELLHESVSRSSRIRNEAKKFDDQ